MQWGQGLGLITGATSVPAEIPSQDEVLGAPGIMWGRGSDCSWALRPKGCLQVRGTRLGLEWQHCPSWPGRWCGPSLLGVSTFSHPAM